MPRIATTIDQAGSRLDGRAGVVLFPLALLNVMAFSLARPGAGGPLAAAILWATCLSLLAAQRPRGLLSLECLYLLLLGLFHLGTAVPAALGIEELPEWMESSHFAPALGLFSAATCAFTLGACLRGRPADDGERRIAAESSLVMAGLGLATIGAIMLVAGALQLGIFSGPYDDYYVRARTTDVRVFGMGLMLFPMGMLIATVGATPSQMYLLAAIFGAIFGPLFVAGFRGHAIVHAVALATVWARKDARVARRLAIVGGIAIFLLAPAIRAARNRDHSFAEAVRKVQPLEFLTEAGGSMYPLVATHELINRDREPLWMGLSYRVGLDTIIPNVSLTFRPAWGRNDENNFAPLWLTERVDPWLAEHGGSYGFSAVAEPYLNFGWPGVVAFFVGLGYLLRAAEAWFTRDPFRAAMVAASFGFVLWTVRNDITTVFRAVAFACGVVLAVRAARRHVSSARLSGDARNRQP